MSQTASDLCLQCAICCDGTLFSRVPLTPTERRSLEARGLELTRRTASGGASLPLACQGLEGCRCTLYEARPGSCRAYRCDLLIAVEEGRIRFEDAAAIIEETKRLRRNAVNAQLDAFLDRHFHGRAQD